MNSACAVWKKGGDNKIVKHKYSVQQKTSTEVDQSQRAAMTKNYNREHIKTSTKPACIISSPLPFAWSSNNKCCPLAACPLLCSSHLTAGSLLQRSGGPGRSCPAHSLHIQTSSSFPASLAGTAEQPGFLWWVTGAQSFPTAHNMYAHFTTVLQLSGSVC